MTTVDLDRRIDFSLVAADAVSAWIYLDRNFVLSVRGTATGALFQRCSKAPGQAGAPPDSVAAEDIEDVETFGLPSSEYGYEVGEGAFYRVKQVGVGTLTGSIRK